VWDVDVVHNSQGVCNLDLLQNSNISARFLIGAETYFTTSNE
jgi:hypothetical protein